MRTRTMALLAGVVFEVFVSVSAWADILYNNGPFWTTLEGTNISALIKTSDSFVLNNDAALTGVRIGLIVNHNATATSVEWSIGDTPEGATHGHATAFFTDNQLIGTNTTQYGDIFDLYESSIPLSVSLGAGTYWLTLTNSIAGGDSFWNINNGPSLAYYDVSALGGFVGYLTGRQDLGFGPGTNSESFRIYGTPSAPVPEPGSYLLLGTGLGVIGLAAWRRRK